ncbi:MAG TPA: choice-of-anchor P family protein [Vicinamibacterales bacterium]|jgi:hypothetical protein|nr:choice-of-anchor P family protein [Vicinamibacterales bacterium]
MKNAVPHHSSLIALCSVLAVLASAVPATAQSVSGQARAIQASVVNPLGGITTTVLVDTGTLSNSSDAREASSPTGTVTSLVTGSVLHATAIGWTDQAAAEASVGELRVTAGPAAVTADFVMARAKAVTGSAGTAAVNIDGLMINGLPVTVTGIPNQTITIPGGNMVINEQSTGSTGTVVNALHIITAAADVVIASATARVQ